MNLENRVVTITGATGGLGRVAARTFAELGAQLALVSTSSDKLNELASELGMSAERILTKAIDLSQPQSAQDALQSVLKKFDKVDVLLHLVGGWIGGKPLVETEAQQTANMLQQHLWTTYYMAQVFLPAMVANGWGRMIVVSSPTASRPLAKSGPYAIGKAAQEALVLTLAQEIKGTGVTANILQVRTIDTQHERDRQPSAQNASWTTPEEIIAAVLYLCSDESRMVNGARLPLYGSY